MISNTLENASLKITLRPAIDDDAELLYTIYVSTRAGEVSQFGWDESQADAFLRMQFQAREQSYGIQFPEAQHSIIMNGDTPAGRLIVDRTGEHILVTDIAVLPLYRGQGIGSHIMNCLQNEAAVADKPLVVRVYKSNNAAAALYLKLGFTITRETDLMFELTSIPRPPGWQVN